MATDVSPHDFPEIRWHGRWIWLPETPAEASPFPSFAAGQPRPPAHALFRRALHLDQVPQRAPARLTADSRYALYVNGREAARGPVRSQPRRLHYDLLDLAPYLQPGKNVIAVYVRYYGLPTSFWMPAVPNMRLGRTGVLVFEADLSEAGWLTSDEEWKTLSVDAWAEEQAGGPGDHVAGGVPVEMFDARRCPAGWQETEFDDSAWPSAQVVPAIHIGGFARTQPPADPYGPLYPRPIAPLGGEMRVPATLQLDTLAGQVDASIHGPASRVAFTMALPVSHTSQPKSLPITVDLAASGPVRLMLDMGRIVSGTVKFELEAPAGTVLDLCYVEDPLQGPPRGPFGPHAGTRYIARGADDRFEVFDSNGFRYAYILIHSAQGSVTLASFGVQERIYPWKDGASFACDDEQLNRIYSAGVRTVDLNSHDAFLDCPTREQRAWVGDAVVHQMVHLATNCDWRLAWHYLTLGNSPRSDGILPMSVAGDIEAGGGLTIPDWALHWVHGVYNRYRFEGDRDAVKALMPTVERILRWYAPYQTSAGLLKDVVEWNLVDWSSVSTQDTSSIINALWARGLREFAELAAWLEERSSQRWAEALYARVRAGFEVFWDETRSTYIDHIVDGEPSREMSQLAGALAIVSGLAPQAHWARIIETITAPERLVVRSWTGGGGDYDPEKMRKQFMGIYEPDWDVEREIVLAEPFMSYVMHDAVAAAGCADKLPDLCLRWSEFLVDGYDTIGECWGWGTHVHGWSCTPTRDLVFYVLGVTPAHPGYETARVAPRLGRLAWARGVVPTPHGLITVEANAERVTIDSPVPVVLDMKDQPPRRLAAGRHEVTTH